SSAKDYFAKEFGDENIRYATVHLDESTPHMHMGIVPFDDDKKLSAKRVFNRKALFDVQENLPKHLKGKGFDIQRGVKGSKRKNLTVPEFKELKAEQKEIERMIEIKKDELLAYNKEINVNEKLNVAARKEMKSVKVETDEKNFFGVPKTKTVEKWSGNLVISEEGFLKIKENIKNGRKAEEKLNAILETDVYQENRQLKEENNKVIDD